VSIRTHSNAIVLGTEVNGIAVIRSLGRLGVRCAAVRIASRTDVAQHSRFLSFVSDVRRDAPDAELLSAVLATADRLGGTPPIVLIPTTDRFSEFLGRTSEKLSARFISCNPDEATCDAFLDKWKTALLCRANNILVPETACPHSVEELEAISASMSYPVIVKPRFTYGTVFPGKNAVFDDLASLREFFGNSALLGHCVVQEIIPSGDGDILVVATYSGSDGHVKAIYSGRKLRQFLPDYGATCFGISERHPDLEEASRTFLDNIGYKGFAALEFARSRANGSPYFLELNTRTYYHNQLFADAGIDLTQIGYLDRTGQEVIANAGFTQQRDGIVWLDFRRDFQSMRIKRRQGRLTLARWAMSLFRARSFAIWNVRDPLPFLIACCLRVREVTRNVLTRLSRPMSEPQ
jgi:D-aspartate ligase